MYCGDLQANTAVTISLGPFLDDDDALTEKTGLTIQDTTVFLSKNGGAKANPNDTDDCGEDANGVYTKALDTTDTNTEGLLTVYVHESDALYIRQDYTVLSQAAYASKYTAKDTGYADVHVKTTDATAFDAVLKTSTFALAMADAIWDEILTGATHNVATSAGRRLRNLQDFGVYEGGAVYVDTVNGVAGTTDFENGTVNNPTNLIASGLTIAASVGLKTIKLISGSSDTLAASYDNYEIIAEGSTLALGGQSVSGTQIIGATVTGNDDGSNGTATHYINCTMGNSTLGLSKFTGCALGGDLIIAEAGTYYFNQCYSGVAGTATPSLDFQDANENKNVNYRHYSGGIELKNFGHGTADHNMSLEGFGQYVLNANCSNADAGDALAVRGHFDETDNVGGGWGGTITNTATFHHNAIIDSILTDTGELQTDWANGGRLDLLIDAIKAKSDLLNFNGNYVQSDVKEINDVTLTGTGVLGDEWGP